MTDMLVPEVRRVGAASVTRRNWRGQTRGERLTYRWKTRPFIHQVQAVKDLLGRGYGGALLMDPRTGKTKTVVDYASILHTAGKVDRVLIFCPVSVLGVWEEEFKKNCPVPYRLLVWDADARRRYDLPQVGGNVLDVVVMNYDALSTPGRAYVDKRGYKVRSKSRGGRYDVVRDLTGWAPHLIVLDESHRIKDPEAKKSKMLYRLAPLAEYKVIMTGTLVTKKQRLHDVYGQWLFLNPERFPMSYREFKDYYGRWINRNGYEQWVSNLHETDLHRRIHLDSFAISRAECFDLPPRLPPQVVRVELTDSARAYDDMATEMVHQIETGEIAEANIALVQSLRLRQLTSGMAKTSPSDEYPEGRLYRVGSEKLAMLRDILVDLRESDEKVVVAAQFVADIEAIGKLCDELKIPSFMLYGAVRRVDRDNNIRRFREHGRGSAAFIMQPQAGSLGIDLSTAGTFVWYSLTDSYVNYTQAEDRIALNKSVRGTRFIYMLARDTVDELLYQTLQEDGDVARAIMRSPSSLLRSANA